MFFDFQDFRIGTATDEQGPTGCTTLIFDGPTLAAIDIRGGAAAVRESSSVEWHAEFGSIDALVLSGGSSYGLAAVDGVMHSLLEERHHSVAFADIPAVPGAVVYDFTGRSNSIYPDAALGKLSFENAKRGEVSVGFAGAGRNVSVGKYFGRAFSEPGGQGAAFQEFQGIKVFALSVVNAVGAILDEQGSVLRGHRDEQGQRHTTKELFRLKNNWNREQVSGNTTLTAIVTNVELSRPELSRLATMVHTSMAQVIDPFHTAFDGDVLFAMTTGKAPRPHQFHTNDLSVLASQVVKEAVWDAIR
jgi:L-aminopeptidase/D-esterase-like protein